jgi:hypothetical protein
MRTRFIALAAVLMAVSLPGCGGETLYRVTGEVSWEGVPIEDGQINFLPEDGNIHPATAKIVNGRYDARVAAGRMKVEVHGQKDMGYNAAMHQNTKKHYVSAEYSFETTLRFDVEKHDSNVADFHLPRPK